MKQLLIPIWLSTISIALSASNLLTVYPLIDSPNTFHNIIRVLEPKIKQLWIQNGEDVYFGLYYYNKTAYVCVYPVDPRNYGIKKLLEEWRIESLDGKSVAVGDISGASIRELTLTGVIMNNDGTYTESPYYFGSPIPLMNVNADSVRIVLINAKLRFFIFFAILQPFFGHTDKQRETIDIKTFSKTVYEAIQALPPQEGYLRIEAAGGMTDQSAWQWYLIELQERSPAEFLKSYFSSINQRLIKMGILTGGPPVTGDTHGLRAFCLKSPDKKIIGTISIVIKAMPDNRLAIVVSSAVSGDR